METYGERSYLLTIKRNNNDYLPVEWNLTSLYNGENLYTLEGIDEFTRKITRADLLYEAINENILDGDEPYQSFAIIYSEKGKKREVKEGTIFLEDENIFSEDELINFIADKSGDKVFLNGICNMLNFRDDESKVSEFKFILKNIDMFKSRGNNAVLAALSVFKEMSYEKKRLITIKVSKKMLPKLNKDSNILRRNKAITYGKVA